MTGIDVGYHAGKMAQGYRYITYGAYLNPTSMTWQGQGGRYCLSLKSSHRPFLISRPGWLEVYKTVTLKSLSK